MINTHSILNWLRRFQENNCSSLDYGKILNNVGKSTRSEIKIIPAYIVSSILIGILLTFVINNTQMPDFLSDLLSFIVHASGVITIICAVLFVFGLSVKNARDLFVKTLCDILLFFSNNSQPNATSNIEDTEVAISSYESGGIVPAINEPAKPLILPPELKKSDVIEDLTRLEDGDHTDEDNDDSPSTPNKQQGKK